MHLVLWGDISWYFVLSGFDITGVECMYVQRNLSDTFWIRNSRIREVRMDSKALICVQILCRIEIIPVYSGTCISDTFISQSDISTQMSALLCIATFLIPRIFLIQMSAGLYRFYRMSKNVI